MKTNIYRIDNNGNLIDVPTFKAFPIGTRVYGVGYAGAIQIFCVAGKEENGRQKIVLTSEYYEDGYFSPISHIDRNCNPFTKRYGIGFYWDDKEYFSYSNEQVFEFIERAERLTKMIQAKKDVKNESDRKEKQDLPAMFPHLTPIGGTNDYKEIYKILRSNIVAELKKNFPDTKFSIKKEHYSCIRIEWTNGASENKVNEIVSKFKDHEFDVSGDYHDYEPSNFNEIFGGIEYVFCNREYSSEINALFEEFKGKFSNFDEYNLSRAFGEMKRRAGFPGDAKNFIIRKTGKKAGLTSEIYEISCTEEKREDQEEVSEPKNETNNIELVDYSEKAIAVFGETYEIREELKKLGGKFNRNLKGRAGWIFPKSRQNEVADIIINYHQEKR